MLKTMHPIAGALALVLITTFWLSTVLAEVFAGPELVALVKAAIPWGFLLLVPFLALAGLSGFRLAGKMRGAAGRGKAQAHADHCRQRYHRADSLRALPRVKGGGGRV